MPHRARLRAARFCSAHFLLGRFGDGFSTFLFQRLSWEGVKLELANGFSVGGGQLNVEKRFCSVGVVVGLAGARARSSRPRAEAGPQLAERPPSPVACIV